MGSRTKKSIINAEVGFISYLISLFLAFFSRKIFLDNLGAEFIGLTGTLSNILGILNLSEMGIGLCISYFLFKPIANNDHHEICNIISLLGYLYKRIGYFIVSIGIFVSLLFPWIFSNTNMSYGIIYFSFYSLLASNAVGYFINYRQTLLGADQKMYLVNTYNQGFVIFKSVLQIFLAYYYKNLYVWVAIEFIFSLIYCIILNWRIEKEYPWLETDKQKGKFLLKEYPDVIKKTKQILIHRLKDFLLMKSDEIMIFAFVSLKMVAYYGNYTMIIGKLTAAFFTMFSGISAGIGNLVAEGNKKHILEIFWQLSSLKYFITGILVFILSFLINPFIAWWLGEEYQLSTLIVILLMINLFIMQTRQFVDSFNHTHGLYGDVWAAWTEFIINIIVTISIAINWGIIGILMGKIISLLVIVVIWKPYYLFTQGIKEPVSTYWKGVGKYYLCFFISLSYMIGSMYLFSVKPSPDIISMSLFGIKIVIPTIILYAILLYQFGNGFREITNRIPLKKIMRRKDY
jgi:O-antigen/teichoic acid export membrane protein